MRTALILATIAVWSTALGLASPTPAMRLEWTLDVAKSCPGQFQGIAYYRGQVWRYERKMGARVTRASYAEHAVGSCDAVTPFVSRWRTLSQRRAKEYRAYLKALRSTGIPAGTPPHYSSWLCIHRFEGSWTDPNPPYYGGLQMDLGFQKKYGGKLLRLKGTADHWTPREQMWVAEIAHASGRGFYPWPNTARYCGLI